MTCQTDVNSLTKIIDMIKNAAYYYFQNDIIIKINEKYWITKKYGFLGGNVSDKNLIWLIKWIFFLKWHSVY